MWSFHITKNIHNLNVLASKTTVITKKTLTNLWIANCFERQILTGAKHLLQRHKCPQLQLNSVEIEDRQYLNHPKNPFGICIHLHHVSLLKQNGTVLYFYVSCRIYFLLNWAHNIFCLHRNIRISMVDQSIILSGQWSILMIQRKMPKPLYG